MYIRTSVFVSFETYPIFNTFQKHTVQSMFMTRSLLTSYLEKNCDEETDCQNDNGNFGITQCQLF